MNEMVMLAKLYLHGVTADVHLTDSTGRDGQNGAEAACFGPLHTDGAATAVPMHGIVTGSYYMLHCRTTHSAQRNMTQQNCSPNPV